MKINTIIVTVLLLIVSGLSFAQKPVEHHTTLSDTVQPGDTRSVANADTTALIDQLKAAYLAGDLVKALAIQEDIKGTLEVEQRLFQRKSAVKGPETSPAELVLDDGVVAKITFPVNTGIIAARPAMTYIKVEIPGAKDFNNNTFILKDKVYKVSYQIKETQTNNLHFGGNLIVSHPITDVVTVSINDKSMSFPFSTMRLPIVANTPVSDFITLTGQPDTITDPPPGTKNAASRKVWSWKRYPNFTVTVQKYNDANNLKVVDTQFDWK